MIDKTNWTPENLAWMAGLLEGEGSFLVDRKRWLKISCEMKDEDVILRLKRFAGFGNLYTSNRTTSKRDIERDIDREKHSKTYRWYSGSSKDIYEFELAILPYMGERRAKTILETHRTRREYEETLTSRGDSLGRPVTALRRVFPDTR